MQFLQKDFTINKYLSEVYSYIVPDSHTIIQHSVIHNSISITMVSNDLNREDLVAVEGSDQLSPTDILLRLKMKIIG